MTALKLLKKQWGRRRFVESAPLGSLLEWDEVALKLKEKILTETNLQIVGPKILIKISEGDEARVLLEVLGLPVTNLKTVDVEALSVLIHPYGESVFEADFRTLLSKAHEIKQKIPHQLGPYFHIVIEGHKIGLHFFMQKDYIHAST